MKPHDRQALGEGAWVPEPPRTAPPAAVRAAIKARVLARSLGHSERPVALAGRYRLVREIGRGGAGTVWEAELLPLGRRVAVKLLRATPMQTADVELRLVREAMTTSRLGHDHIVRVDDVGIDEHGARYVAMELLRGRSLAETIVARGPLPWADVAVIALQLCDALAAAHAAGVVHRDIKPANVFVVARDDGRWHCKLLDFGLCKSGVDDGGPLTAQGTFLGTPGYVAPEQVRGQAVDGRADLYGLGCVMVELLTGRPAFAGKSRHDVLQAQLQGRPIPHLEAARVPPDVVALLTRALAVEREDRHPDITAFAAAVAGVALGTAREPDATAVVSRHSWVGRGYAFAVATTLVCAGVGAAFWAPDDSAPRVRPPVSPVLGASEPELASVAARSAAAPVPPPPAILTEPKTLPVLPRATMRPPRAATRRRPFDEATKARPLPPPSPRPAYNEGIRDPFADLPAP